MRTDKKLSFRKFLLKNFNKENYFCKFMYIFKFFFIKIERIHLNLKWKN